LTHVHVVEQPSDPVEVFGEIETEALGLAYGAMVFTVKAGATTEPHSHGSEETWWIKAGNGFATVDGKTSPLSTGNRFTVPPNAIHTVTSVANEDLTVVAFWWREAAHG
jgi:mannose-6-phosphate isomerase-like protein (cupin superfamily)